MTQPVNDPWAAQSTPAPVQQSAPADPLAGGYGEADGGSLLFGQANAAPSLMNKTHPLGTERGGVIKSLTTKQDQDYNSQLPKYFSLSKVGGERKDRAVTTDPIDGPTGKPNNPVMVTHIELETEYRMTEAEAIASSRDGKPRDITRDDGKRIEVVGGLDVPAFQAAMEEARKSGISLTKPADLKGLVLRVKRAGQKPNPGGNPSWVKAYRIEKAPQ